MRPKALAVLALWGSATAALAAPTRPDVQGLLAGVPLHFERNDGQVDSRVRFLARGSGYGLYLTADEAVLALRTGSAKTSTSDPEVVRWRLVGANPSAEVAGEELLSGKANYLIGDRAGWHTDVPLYGRVRYADVYPGVSLTYYGNQRQLEYDLELAPHADPRRIRFRIEGAESTRIDDEGRLRIRTRRGEVVQHAPVVYQTKDGVREPVAARFRGFGKREVGFEVATYDRSRPLVIDPKIDFSTYLGGTLDEEAADVALQGTAGNLEVYVVGTTVSTDFVPPLSIVNPGGRLRAGKDIFVVKMRFSAGALSIVYSIYLGGDRDDEGVAIALDIDSGPVITAQTDSTDIYAPNTFGPRGGIDVWVAKIVNDGNALVWATRFGGEKEDIPRGLFVEGSRDVFVVGLTRSDGFPDTFASVPPPFQTSLLGAQDGFFTVLVANGSSMSYSTYLGGAGTDEANGVVVRSAETYIVGTTDSADFRTTSGAFQEGIGGGAGGVNDAFVMSFRPAGISRDLSWSTFLGGKFPESGAGIDADTTGVYVVGTSESPDDFPLQDPFQAGLRGPNDAFLSKLQLDGAKLVFSTYLGGGGTESGHDVAVDSTAHVYVTGTTSSGDFPRVRTLPSPNDALQPPSDAFLTNFAPPGCAVEYSTFVGGKTTDESGGLAVLPTGNAVVVGRTDSNDLPVFPLGAFGVQGLIDAFAMLINETDPGPDVQVTKIGSADPAVVGGTLTYTVEVKNLDLFRPAHNVRLQDTILPGGTVTILGTTPGGPACSTAGQTVTCDFACLGAGQTVTVSIDVRVDPPAFPQITNQAQVVVPEDPFLSNNLTSLTTQVVLPADVELTKSDLADPVDVGQTFNYSLEVRNNGPGVATNVVVEDTLPSGVAFVSATPPCGPPVGGVVTCNLGTLAASGFQTLMITVRATGAGVVINDADVTALEPDPMLANNTASEDTTVNVAPGAVEFFTVRSSNLENLLEWKNPVLGGAANIAIYRHDTPCVFEPEPPTGIPIHVDTAPVSNDHGSFVDALGLANDVTYCYSIYVDINGDASVFSPGRYNKGRPFDSITGKVRWEFNIGTSSLAPVGNGVGVVHSVATDKNLYAMLKGAVISPGLGGGKWPTGYLPYFITGPSQGRPGGVPISPGPPTRATFLSSDNGRVFAIDSDRGSAGTELWISPVLGGVGTVLVAPPSGSFTMFGATRDLIYVGSRDPAGSQLYGLRLATGIPGPPDGWAQIGGAPHGPVGAVSGQAAVDYPSHRVYFTSRAFGGVPTNKTVWCVDFETGAIVWATAHGDIDGSLSLKGNHLYAATNDGRVIAIRTSDGLADWTFTIPAAEGAAKGYVVTDVLTTNLYFSTNTRVWKLRDDTTAVTELWPGGVPVPGGIPGNAPSIPVFVPGGPHVWVGGSDQRLHRLNVLDGSGFDFFALGDPIIPNAVGSPTIDLSGGFVYVGTEAGRVYAIQP